MLSHTPARFSLGQGVVSTHGPQSLSESSGAETTLLPQPGIELILHPDRKLAPVHTRLSESYNITGYNIMQFAYDVQPAGLKSNIVGA